MVLKPYLKNLLWVNLKVTTEAVSWALLWLPEGGELIAESYVNLIPTVQGGTHVNGLRQGLLNAMTEYCEFRNKLPRGCEINRRRHLGSLCLHSFTQNAGCSICRPKRKNAYLPVKVRSLLQVFKRCLQFMVTRRTRCGSLS